MNSFERRNKIVDMVNTQGSVLVLDLSNLFGISEVTIRADLRLLEEKGLLTRFHGGAARAGSDLTDTAISLPAIPKSASPMPRQR